EFGGGGGDWGDGLFHNLRLTHQRDVAWRCFVPAGGDADERLVDLLGGQTHRVIEGAMWCAIRPFGGVPARKFRLQTALDVHRSLSPGPGYPSGVQPTGGTKAAGLADIDVVEWYGQIAARLGLTSSLG